MIREPTEADRPLVVAALESHWGGVFVIGVDPGAVDRARALKPTIPLVGDYGIELHDELILEVRLAR